MGATKNGIDEDAEYRSAERTSVELGATPTTENQMFSIPLSFEQAHAVMKVISDYTSADFETLGVTPEDYALAASQNLWLNQHRPRVERVMEALLYGTTDLLGIGRIELPAEYIAAVVSTFIAPGNRRTACTWLSERKLSGTAANQLATGLASVQMSPASSQQLFALVIALSETDASTEARKNFTTRIDSRLRAAAGIEEPTKAKR